MDRQTPARRVEQSDDMQTGLTGGRARRRIVTAAAASLIILSRRRYCVLVPVRSVGRRICMMTTLNQFMRIVHATC